MTRRRRMWVGVGFIFSKLAWVCDYFVHTAGSRTGCPSCAAKFIEPHERKCNLQN